MTTLWIKLNNGNSHPVKVKIDENDDIADLCSMLKNAQLSDELKGIGLSQIDIKSPNSLKSFRRSIKIKELPETTDETPLIIGTTLLNDAEQFDSKYLMTPSSQHSASSISNGSLPLRGFGSLPSSFRIDATDKFAVSSALCPTDDDIANVSEDMPLTGELMDMIPRGEDDAKGISIIFGDSSSLFHSTTNGTTTLRNIKLDLGLATPASQCDHLLMGQNKLPSGLIELKGGKYSPLQGNRQAAVYGTHFAMGLLKRGFPAEQVIVPSYTYTGMQIQFGVTIILEPSFPVYWTTSKLLDMADANERRLAVAYIKKANSWINYLSSLPHSQPIPLIGMSLNTSAYFIKTLTDDVCKRGFELFSDRNSDMSQGIEHWGRVLNLLFKDHDVRPHVAFPLAIRSPNTSNDENEYMIIFKDLCAEGYQIGCPDRVIEQELFNSFREEYRRIVKKIHGAGVIHCDLYLSNVMWRLSLPSSGKMVDIIIIDWDCAHCLMEGKFNPKVQEAFKTHKPNRGAEFGTSFDDRYVEVLYREYIDSEREYWGDLASGIKSRVDTAFYHLFDQM